MSRSSSRLLRISEAIFIGGLALAAPAPAAEPVLKNGDANGDGTIDLSDAVYLLQSLFLGGPPPKAITCPQCPDCPDPCPPVTQAQVRLLDDITCSGGSTNVSLDLCGTQVTWTTGSTSSDCKEVAFTGSTCHAKLLLTAASCAALDFCADIPFQDGHVYDVVAYFNSVTQMPAAMWFDRSPEAGGACPAFPTPADPPTGHFTMNCPAGGEVSEGEAWDFAEGLWAGR